MSRRLNLYLMRTLNYFLHFIDKGDFDYHIYLEFKIKAMIWNRFESISMDKNE